MRELRAIDTYPLQVIGITSHKGNAMSLSLSDYWVISIILSLLIGKDWFDNGIGLGIVLNIVAFWIPTLILTFRHL